MRLFVCPCAGGEDVIARGQRLQADDEPAADRLPDEGEPVARGSRSGSSSGTEIDVYKQSLETRTGGEPFILHDGPPYANGHIHMGTGYNKVLKDLIVKYKSMRGYYAPYVPGWDCHGQPIEHQVEKKLGPEKMAKISQAKLRELCRDWAMEFVDVQREEFKRLGVRGDWDDPYLTLNHSYEAGDVRVFAKMYERGEIYKGRKPIHWCKRCHTALAEAEIEYSDEKSDSIYVKFRVTDELPAFSDGGAAGLPPHLDHDAVDAAGQRRRHPRGRRRLRGRSRGRGSASSSPRRWSSPWPRWPAGIASRWSCGADGEPCASRARDLEGLHYAQPIHEGVDGRHHHGRARRALHRYRRRAHRSRSRRGGLPRRHEVRASDADAGRRRRRVR